jgi:hypothetical protein
VYYLHHQGDVLQRDYTAMYPRKLLSSVTLSFNAELVTASLNKLHLNKIYVCSNGLSISRVTHLHQAFFFLLFLYLVLAVVRLGEARLASVCYQNTFMLKWQRHPLFRAERFTSSDSGTSEIPSMSCSRVRTERKSQVKRKHEITTAMCSGRVAFAKGIDLRERKVLRCRIH